jgi:hypothetical protein
MKIGLDHQLGPLQYYGFTIVFRKGGKGKREGKRGGR